MEVVKARLAGMIVFRDGSKVYVYNCLRVEENELGEQVEEYLGDVVLQSESVEGALRACTEKYGGGST